MKRARRWSCRRSCVAGTVAAHADRSVRRARSCSPGQVGPRPPRHVPADARGELLHPRADARAGPHRVEGYGRARSPGSSASSRSSSSCAPGNDLILRNELAFLGGAAVAALVMGIALLPRMRRGPSDARGPRRGHRARTARDLTAAELMGALRGRGSRTTTPQQHRLPAVLRAPGAAEAVDQERPRHRRAGRGRRARRTTALSGHADRVRVLLPRRERHLLPERRARRRGRPPAPDEAEPPGRGRRGLGAHRDHRRRSSC